jgi:hypothetical protein
MLLLILTSLSMTGCGAGRGSGGVDPRPTPALTGSSASSAGPLEELAAALDGASAGEEQWNSEHGSYTDRVADIRAAGLADTSKVTLAITLRGKDSYCIEGRHADLPGRVAHITTSGVATFEGPCSAGRATPLQGTPAPTPVELLEDKVLELVSAEETYFGDHGTLTADVARLIGGDYRPDPSITVAVRAGSADRYCVQGTSVAGVRHYDTEEGELLDGPCGATTVSSATPASP